ncbi:DNA-binding response regulator [Elizabethkingia miricola]|uniref:LytTR family DNA-binding domain-containing protein n=1 Tax=Elizabethkingia miricola TaxID=172045 RepID=A0ABD5B4Z7_ELIMR|nr:MULTISPECIES: LytTR family DNA-binding domain-containing protein [Elizabethkingia]MDQ8748469.1 LytTR family DNA-binding domain-containing protein [Elizabethkingia miricola]OBS11150.1 DNA-binding response regulator [Elizabethkingia miricola]OPB88106.1 DNA-binding response regulator [Elizabethkingia miricola]TYO91761.1 LytTR family two component transcriptional regulator [Elizabethkingia miricola]
MKKYLIVEDERLAFSELKRMMDKLRPEYILLGRTQSVLESIEFLQQSKPDFILMDISLSDGSCFEIFNHIKVEVPIIFTTAYDEYAIQAFKVNSIDYLLKPVSEEDLERAIAKLEDLHFDKEQEEIGIRMVESSLMKKVKNRFLVQSREGYLYAESKNIAYFYSEEKVVLLHTFDDKRYIINYTLDQLEGQLSDDIFFRVSRNCIANIKAIKGIKKVVNSRLGIDFEPECPHEIIVSRVRVQNFLEWLNDD